MKCKTCEAIFGGHYKSCPNCNSVEMEREKFTSQPDASEEIVEANPLLVNGEFNFEELSNE
jgi:hypothetical protein